jgi:hypothetical protein
MTTSQWPPMPTKRREPEVLPVVFTGPRTILAAQVSYVQAILDALKANVFITGGAPGIDLFVAGECERRFPNARHIMVIPFGYKHGATEQSAVGFVNRGHEVLDMPRPRNKSRHPNLLRNDYMCELAMELNPNKAKLVAFPGSAIEQQRSGTWSCIRSARRISLPVEIHPLADAPGMTDYGMFPGVGTDPTARFDRRAGRIVREGE